MNEKAGLSQLKKSELEKRRPVFTPQGKSHLERTLSNHVLTKPDKEGKKTRLQDNKMLKKHQEKKAKRGMTAKGSDSDYDTDLEEDVPPSRKMTPTELYHKICRALGVTPAKYYLKHMTDHSLDMNWHGLGPQGVKAISVPLQINNITEKLALEGNWMGVEGAEHIAYMLTENNTITDLNISYNCICGEGARELCNVLSWNSNLQILDLSGNGFEDKDAEPFKQLLDSNKVLTELYLSNNDFREKGAMILAKGIAENDTLKVLDLSWNHIRLKGAQAIAFAIKENMCLHTLNLSMNGFANNGAKVLAKALRVNYTLVELDISNNRIGMEGCGQIAKAMKKNDGIEHLRIGLNPIQFGGAMALINAIKSNEENVVQELDLSGITVNQEFMHLVGEVRMKQDLDVKVGFVSSSNEMGGVGQVFSDKNPLEILLIFMSEQNLRLVDLFKSLDKDNSMSLTRDEFIEGLKDLETPLTMSQLEELIGMLDKDGDGEVDLKEIMNINKEHRALKRKVNRRMMKKREQAIAKAKAVAALLEAVPEVYTDKDAERDAALLNALVNGFVGANEEDDTVNEEIEDGKDTNMHTTEAPSGDESLKQSNSNDSSNSKTSTPTSPTPQTTDGREPTQFSQRQKTKSVSNLWKPTHTGSVHNISLNKALHE